MVTIEEVDGVVLNEIEAIKIFNDTSLDPTKTYDLKYKNEVGDRTVSAYLLGNTSSIGARTSTNNNTKWAFVRVGGKRYMYNVEQKKFVTTTGSLDADPSKAGHIGIVASGDGTYGYREMINKIGVNNLSQFVNSKVYYIRCKRGSLILNKDTGSGQYILMSPVSSQLRYKIRSSRENPVGILA
ncbi:MAG: hypothetical protein IJ762_02760 [Bacteroidaceae bacterium]|nr:hypothetical protein [Bacteroidaceae bacterium]